MKTKEEELAQRELVIQQREQALNDRERHLNQLTEALYYRRQQQHFGSFGPVVEEEKYDIE